MSSDHRIWTGRRPDGTWILVNLWRLPGGDQLDVAFRDEQWHTWGPPIRLTEQIPWLSEVEPDRWNITDRD